MDPLLAARLRLLTVALLFSTGPAGIKACQLGPWQVAGFRSGTAALAILLLVPASRRLTAPRLWLVGIAYACTLICYALSSKLTTAANAIFLQSTAPVYILVLSPLLLHEKVRRRDLLFVLAMLGGMALLAVGHDDPTAVATDPARGNVLALVSGVFWALTLLGLRWLERDGGGGQGAAGGQGAPAVVIGNGLAFLFCLPMAFPVGPSRPVDWLWIGYLGVVQIGLSYILLARAMGRVPALEAALLLMLEPVLVPLWSWLAHDERPTGWALAGGAVILAATLVRTVGASAAPRAAPAP